MTDPQQSIRLRIILALQRRFRQAMKTARGYHYEPPAESSVSVDPNEILLVPSTELPYYLLLPQPEGELKLYPAYQKREVLVLAILARIDVTDPSIANSKLEAWENLIADIEQCIGEEDPALDFPGVGLGGLCVDMRLRRPRPLAGLGPDPIVVVEQFVEIPFHARYGSPASQS